MGDEFVVERTGPKRPRPLVSLPRGRRRDLDGVEQPPVVDLFVEFAKATAGCCVCDKPIPKETTRLTLRVALREPVVGPDGARRVTERYYLHPGCITERVRPEVIRFGLDCYDCGRMPPNAENSMMPVRYGDFCFTVSRFSPAPLCVDKPKWSRCDLCQIHYPPWMISAIARKPQPVVEADIDPSVFSVRDTLAAASDVCEYCARRFDLTTVDVSAREEEEFLKLRKEIAEHGFHGAGSPE